MKNHSEDKSVALFKKLFPDGFAGKDVFSLLAPAGWEKSNLYFCFHPTIEQQFEEAVRIHENLKWLTKKKEEPQETPPTIEKIKEEYSPSPVKPKRELQEIVGYCLWDIFSDNHEVIDEKGIYEIGSFRGAAGFIADYLNLFMPGNKYDYMDFYMGSIWIRTRADLFTVYRMIFHRLKNEGCFWKYFFPRMGIVDFSEMKEEKENIAEYSPEKSFLKEKEKEEKQREIRKLRSEFDRIYENEKRTLKANPPATVRAYFDIYGTYPFGWEDSGD